MRLIALEIPEDPAELAGWLERHLVGPDLAALVAELEAVHGRASEAEPSARGLLGQDLDAVLVEGLSALAAPALKRLLRRPRLLLDLQELVLASGGDHWDRLAHEGSPELAGMVERGRLRLLDALPGVDPAPPEVARATRPRGSPRRAWLVGLAAAASVLVGALAFERSRPPAPSGPSWGWAKAGALPSNLTRDAYLVHLADSAEQWFARHPDDPMALARRIGEFRQGCSTLILAEHPPLPAGDRAWLVEKCRAWAMRLDAHLAEVESRKDPATVRSEVDETVRKLIAALRDRSSRPA